MARRGGGRDQNQNEITKNIKQGPVEVDYEESSLVVHYEIEMVSNTSITMQLSSYFTTFQ